MFILKFRFFNKEKVKACWKNDFKGNGRNLVFLLQEINFLYNIKFILYKLRMT